MDIQKNTKSLNLTMEFVDGDTRLLSVDNPKDDDVDALATNIKSLQSEMVTNQPLLGDKDNANFKEFKKAVVVEKTVTSLDISL